MKYKMLNWDKADISSPVGSLAVKRAINQYLANSEKSKRELAANYFTLRTDFPADGYPSLEQVRRQVEADLGWQLVFKVLDFTVNTGAGGETGFDVAAAGSGLVLEQVLDGQKAKVYEAQGDSIRIPFVRYEGGLLYIKTLIEDGRWWDMEDNMLEAQNAYWNSLASTHYSLLDAVGAGINVAWQNPTPAALANTDPMYTISRDANTINAAIISIINASNGWQAINANSDFGIVCPLELVQRLRQAVAADLYGVSRTGFKITIAATTYLDSSSVYYVVPVQKAGRSGIRKEMEIEFDKDILANAETMAVRGRWGAAVVSSNTIRRCATA